MKVVKKEKPTRKEIQYLKALDEIAHKGYGMREDVIDYANVGRSSVAIARKALAGSCDCCGQMKVFKPKARS